MGEPEKVIALTIDERSGKELGEGHVWQVDVESA